jgi:hypothetical protein
VPRPADAIPFCPNCVLQTDGLSSSALWLGFHRPVLPEPVRLRPVIDPPFPWLIPLCAGLRPAASPQAEFLKRRLRLLARPKKVVGKWELKEREERDGFIIPEYKVYQDDLKLPVERLTGSRRYTIAGQLDVEGRDLEEEILAVKESLACYCCQKRPPQRPRRNQSHEQWIERLLNDDLHGLWLCHGCYKAWRRAGEPRGDEYVSFALRRRWPEPEDKIAGTVSHQKARSEQGKQNSHSKLIRGGDSGDSDNPIPPEAAHMNAVEAPSFTPLQVAALLKAQRRIDAADEPVTEITEGDTSDNVVNMVRPARRRTTN